MFISSYSAQARSVNQQTLEALRRAGEQENEPETIVLEIHESGCDDERFLKLPQAVNASRIANYHLAS